MQTLVQKAQSLASNGKTSVKVSDEHIELALAWVDGAVSLKQVQFALGLKSGMPYPSLALYLREYIRSIDARK